MTRTRIKVCCICSHEEAALAVAQGVDALGLVAAMPNGPGVISEERIAAIAGRVGPPVARVLLTSEVTAQAIAAQVRRCGVDTVQICDRVTPDVHPALADSLPGVRRLQVVHVEGEGAIPEAQRFADLADGLLLDSGSLADGHKRLGGTGAVHDWRLSAEIVRRVAVPVFLAGGLRPDNVADAIRAVRPAGVDVCSGLRPAGGLAPGLLQEFVAAVRAVDLPRS